MRRLRNALARAIELTIVYGPVEALRRGVAALLGPIVGGWFP
ncbi:MAG: hypothetical protein Q8S73_12670 [Deltaproteobacteria bacterium]|nr:hypothetical protein [Myxococcales bacterium]MDP3214953.1 hypothetical protein [Deltaproteobacteria bacterium]